MAHLKTTILLVDDEPDIVETAKRKLERSGYRVVTARDGNKAMEMAQADHPDLIVLDVVMPEMNGFEVYKHLKADAALSAIPVIILTARGNMKESFLAVGSDDFLTKPFDINDLHEAIIKALGHSMSDSQGRQKAAIISKEKESGQSLAQMLFDQYSMAAVPLGGEDVLDKLIKFKPVLILLDAEFRMVPPHELVAQIRVQSGLEDSIIVVFSYLTFQEEAVGFTREKALHIKKSSEACMDAGADEYFELITEANFLPQIDRLFNA